MENSAHQASTWLELIPFLPHDPHYIHVNAALVVLFGLTIVSFLAYRGLKGREESHLVPQKSLSLVGIVDMFIEGVYGMLSGALGKHAKDYFPFIATLFIFILFSNLLGLLPLSASPSSSVNTTFALGAATFIYYNVAGVKAHGLGGYLKHFLMGLGPMGVMIAVLESVSHFIRPVSLGLRLFVNMHVDHTVVLSFQNIFAWFTTIPLLGFGILVSVVQAFVFTILTAVYVQMATEH